MLAGWSFFNVLAYETNKDVNFCQNCAAFTLNKDKMKDLKTWWKSVGDQMVVTCTNPKQMSYEEVVQRLVGPSTKSKDFFCNTKQIRDHSNNT